MRPLTRWKALIVGLAVSLLILLCLLAFGRNRTLADHDREDGAPRMVAIRCGRLIDGKNNVPTTNAILLIEGERITAVGRDLKIPAGAEVIDLIWQALDDLRHQTPGNFSKALKGGVWIVMGSDAVAGYHAATLKKLSGWLRTE
jgi:imidazolonepropionase-like amidohydrolase